jgi:hypothetical protein
MLKVGGIFRLVLPDLESLISNYVSDGSNTRAHSFMTSTGLGAIDRPSGLWGLMKNFLGNSQHLWLWDYQSMQTELTAANFSGIRRAQFNDSTDPRFLEVENLARWEGCLGIECLRAC